MTNEEVYTFGMELPQDEHSNDGMKHPSLTLERAAKASTNFFPLIAVFCVTLLVSASLFVLFGVDKMTRMTSMEMESRITKMHAPMD